MDDAKPTAALIAADWLLRTYLPACLELSGHEGLVPNLYHVAAGAGPKQNAAYTNKWLLRRLGLEEPADLADFIAQSAAHPLYGKIDDAIRSEADAALRAAVRAGAGRAWYAAVNAIGVAAAAANDIGELGPFKRKIARMNRRLERLLDLRLKEAATPPRRLPAAAVR